MVMGVSYVSNAFTVMPTAIWISNFYPRWPTLVDDRLYAFDDLCTCTDEACPLSGGLLTGTTIMCQCHGSRFDITTGAVINGSATMALNVYEVQEIEGSIRIRLHPNGSGRR
jgi:nitrite reductase/ring-hydroxylating ferredoxin subunit